jgi:hypothetical protein
MLLQERLEEFPWILSDLIFPFMMEYMMVSTIHKIPSFQYTDIPRL